MKPFDINKIPDFIQVSYGRNPDITGIYCCDLLSMALGKLKENQIFITVISNINTLAVAYQKKASCIVISENIPQDNEFISIAEKYGITVFRTKLSTFEAALKLNEIL